jgi:hypothetical protein
MMVMGGVRLRLRLRGGKEINVRYIPHVAEKHMPILTRTLQTGIHLKIHLEKQRKIVSLNTTANVTPEPYPVRAKHHFSHPFSFRVQEEFIQAVMQSLSQC